MISTHILDTSKGMPASEVVISLEIKKDNTTWIKIGEGSTNSDGRVKFEYPIEKGIYRLNFGIEDYYKKEKLSFFFLDTPVIFQISDIDRNYHVPLLLNPYGYTTYRGS